MIYLEFDNPNNSSIYNNIKNDYKNIYQLLEDIVKESEEYTLEKDIVIKFPYYTEEIDTYTKKVFIILDDEFLYNPHYHVLKHDTYKKIEFKKVGGVCNN